MSLSWQLSYLILDGKPDAANLGGKCPALASAAQ
jgi:hypothetical protein